MKRKGKVYINSSYYYYTIILYRGPKDPKNKIKAK